MIRLEPEELERVRQLLSHYLPGMEIRAFGSRVHGENLKPFSDLDLVIVNDVPLPPLQIAQARDAFSESDLPFRVDLLEWATISQSFREQILKDCEPLLPAAD